MANNDLLKEAIADAKSVKETAIANAKLALEEAFTPHLKSMLSAKLEEMDKDDEDIDESITNEKEEVKEEKEEVEEINLDELLAEIESDLDENKRTDAEEEGYKDGIKDEKEDLEEDERTDAEEEGYKDGEEDEKEDIEGMEDEEIDLEDMSEDDLKGFIEDVIKDLVSDGTIEAGDEFIEDTEDAVDGEEVEDMVDMEDVDIDVEIDEAKAEDLDEMSKKEKAEGDDRKKDDKIEGETEKMRFKEAIDEINALKVEVNEVNLLNAKLLYTNKIFKAKNLSEGKKVKVLKAFDKATTVKEAKFIFETLNEGVISSKSSPMINEVKGSASRATGIISEAKKPIIESNDVYDRMRKLAGLI
tara:strand:- start:998 stop:2074 length:1077 start_codon:yes stop_codon:yes gene_type:complete